MLRNRIQQNVVISDLFDVLNKVINEKNFEMYVNYASEKTSQKEHFDRLM
jgi:hypothetical protein